MQHHQQFKTVMVSAYGNMESIRTAMNRGAFDFVRQGPYSNHVKLPHARYVAPAFFIGRVFCC
jgi:DNA-binding NtrC family response regulator